jgi:aminoglycoside phosphotransferase (APT) family kinase protein
MSTLGDPLTDLGLFLVYHGPLAEIPGEIGAGEATAENGFP